MPEHRAPNGLFYRTYGCGRPLLMLHGLLVSGAMFALLAPFLEDRFRLIVPDLRGHGLSGDLPGPYDVAALAADLENVLQDARVERCSVLGYSHGGAVAQQLCHTRPERVSRLFLACTYACNASTLRERLEAHALIALLTVMSPRVMANLLIQHSRPKPGGEIVLDKDQTVWLRSLMAANRRAPMREAARGLISFDSRPWLGDIRTPTLVIGGTHDAGVPMHHFDTLVNGVPGAEGSLVKRGGHTLIWTHTGEFAEIIQEADPIFPASSVG